MKAIHIAVGAYTLCGRYLRDSMVAGDVPTCKYCISGGIGPHKAKKKQKALLIIQEDEKNGMYQSDNPIMSKLPTDANLYDLNEAYMGFLKWFYKDQFGYILDSHAIDAIFSDMKLYQQSKSL